MGLADELQKLEALRRSGTLSDAEFAQAKSALLAGQPAAPIEHHLSEQLAEVRYQNELARIDREWATERESYYVTDRNGRRNIPTTGAGIATAVLGGGFGVFWTIMAFSIARSGPRFGDSGGPADFFPFIGIVITLVAIGYGIYCYSRALEYEQALARYKARRSQVSADQFRSPPGPAPDAEPGAAPDTGRM
jgi:hypothetical protein